jgi:hypothetical protein
VAHLSTPVVPTKQRRIALRTLPRPRVVRALGERDDTYSHLLPDMQEKAVKALEEALL